MNYKLPFIPTLLFAMVIGFSSCQHDAFVPYEGELLYVKSHPAKDYDIHDLFDVTNSKMGVDMEATLLPVLEVVNMDQIKVRMVPIDYKTVDPTGRERIASGIIIYPLNSKARGVIDVMPFGYLQNTLGGSDYGIGPEHALAFINYIVISPDFLDSGTSKRAHTDIPLGDDAPGNDIYHPFINMESSGQVAYDMHIAAEQYFRKELGMELPKKTSIFGYSEGGTDAMALHRWIDKYDKSGIKIDDTFSGGGAHDLLAAFEVLRERKTQYYCVNPFIIYSIDFWDTSIALDYDKIFNPDGPLLDKDEPSYFRNLLNRGYGFWPTAKDYLGQDLTYYMNEAFFQEWNENNEFYKVLPYLKYNNCSADPDWKPTGTIHLFHAKSDKHIPDICSTSAYNALKTKGANVAYDLCTDFENAEDPHADGGIRFFISCAAYFALK
ncbi:MAG: hypothetical protein WC395_02935 [Bacteroidales bacterium]|jgi:hypothetical protein